MRVYRSTSILVSMEVTERPHLGDQYRDPRNRLWTVRDVRRATIALRGPEEPMEMFEVQFAPEHYAYRVENGEELHPVFTQRHGTGWEGVLWHEQGVGFGSAVQRLPSPELSYGGTNWSWLYRELAAEWVFEVGPHVEAYQHFHDPIFERRGQKLDDPQWKRITDCLLPFQEGED